MLIGMQLISIDLHRITISIYLHAKKKFIGGILVSIGLQYLFVWN